MRKPTWQPKFDVYMATVDESRASFLLDMGIAPHVPIRSHPVRLQVRVQLLHPREDGLRDASELDAMGQLEDTITQEISAALDGIYVGRFTCEGRTTFVFYLPAPQAKRLGVLGSILGRIRPYDSEWLMEDDPDWGYFTEFLYPDLYSQQVMANQQLVANLEEKGDQLEVPREVDHRAYFPTRESAAAATERLRGAGFRTDEPQLLEDSVRPWALDFHRIESLADERPDEFCMEILDIILPFGGTYDGWGVELQA